MKLLILAEQQCDLTQVLSSCGMATEIITVEEAACRDISYYDAYYVIGNEKRLDARVHDALERAAEMGKHVFIEATGGFHGIYSAPAVDTTRGRLIYIDPEDGTGIPGLTTGDLLDDEANRMMRPWNVVEGYKPILVYKNRIIAHTHLDATREEILSGSDCGLWMIGDSIMMTSFHLHNFRRARFAPSAAWEKLIRHIAWWLTGNQPSFIPDHPVRYGTDREILDRASFELCRKEAIERGMEWLKKFLVDNGRGGVREGMCHKINPEGIQEELNIIRNDCSGETAGAFKLYSFLYDDSSARKTAENIDSFTYGPMLVKNGLFDGFMRWSNDAWQVCYQDDVARTVLPGLYDCVFLGNDRVYPEICRALDFLVRTTAQDGCRVFRTDMYNMTETSFAQLTSALEGCRSVHYNGYYHAALLLAYKYGKNPKYLDTARRGLETLMSLYPDTVREQSETQELCRFVLPLAVLYDVTGEDKYREYLYRVVNDLQRFKHPSGGYQEWDTGYKANCSRESTGECSLLTENGDPVVDFLYSVNWLPVGFAYAYYATGDAWFKALWSEIVEFCIRSQICSENPNINGAWCRAFDMDLWEAYGCPHDIGWAAYASESGWTVGEILMGMMLMDVIERKK